jgi:hypothetical protein
MGKDMIILNVYEPNFGAYEFIKQTPLSIREQIDSDTIKVGDLKTQHSSIYRTSR